MNSFTIGEVAQRMSLSVHALRYYEREGLLTTVGRARNGRRVYTETDVSWISLLQCLRSSGMQIQDMRAFAAMVRSGGSVPDRIELLERHREKITADIDALDRALKVVDDKLTRYRIQSS